MSAINNNYSSQDFRYTQNGNVIWFHTKVFRFHASNDFLSLVGSEEQVKAYLVGASSVSIIVLSIFLVWVLMTWILHLHPHRVGFLAGAHMTLPSSSRLPRVVRTIFTLVLGVFILSLMIMLSAAFPKVNKAADTIYSGIHAIDAVVAEELTILDQMQAIGKTIIPHKMILASNLTNYCPSGGLSSLFGDESNYTSVQRAIDDFENILEDELPYYNQLLSSLHAILSKALQARPIFFKLFFSILYCTPLMLLSAAFVLGIIRAWKSVSPLPFQSAQKNVLLPLFSLWTAISCVFVCLVFIYGTLNADFCSGGSGSGSPLGTTLELLRKEGYDEASMEYQSAEYYGTGCSGNDPFEQLYQFYPVLNFGLGTAEGIVNRVASSSIGVSGLSLLCCGTTKCLQPTFYSLELLVDDLNSLLDLVQRTRQLMDCTSSISPILQQTFNVGVCTLSMAAATWMLTLLLLITITGVLVISFRSALFHLQAEEESDFSGSNTIVTDSSSSLSKGESREIEIILSKSKKFYSDETKTWLENIVTCFSISHSSDTTTISQHSEGLHEEIFPEDYERKTEEVYLK